MAYLNPIECLQVYLKLTNVLRESLAVDEYAMIMALYQLGF